MERKQHTVLVAAHRGDQAHQPENTMESFKAAEALHVDQIETDMHLTRDGEIVLIHDHKLDRTTNGTGFVWDYTLKELKVLDAGIKKGEPFKGQKIPLLSEMFEYFKDRPGLTFNLEFKDYPDPADPDRYKRSADRILQLLDDYQMADRCYFNSFSHEVLEYLYARVGKKCPYHGFYPFGIMGLWGSEPDYLDVACIFNEKEENGKMVSMPGRPLDPALYENLRARGIDPWIGADFVEEKDILAAAELGACLITSNDPATALAILKKGGYHD